MSKSRVIVIVVICIFGVSSHLSRAQVLDVNGDDTVGPHEALEVSRLWKQAASSTVGSATNADLLDGLDSTQFLRRDVSDQFSGMKLTIDGALDVGQAGISAHDVNIFGASPGSRLFWDESQGALRAGRVIGTEWDPGNIGLNSVAMGYGTTASGRFSTAMGGFTTASRIYSTAMGWITNASGRFSTAMGRQTTAGGQTSTAMGYKTTASGRTSTAMGSGAIASGYGSFAVGGGPIIIINKDGGVYVSGPTASGGWSTAMGFETTASGFVSTAMGQSTTASGDWSTAMGKDSAASGFASFAVGGGKFNDPGPTATGDFSIAMGRSTTASGDYSTAMGRETTASGGRSTAMGGLTTASGVYSTAMGGRTTASGRVSTAMGESTTASGVYSTAIGREIDAAGRYSVAIALNDQNGTVVAQDNTMAIMGGNVGIGSVTPTTRLHIEDNVAGFVLSVTNDGSNANRAGIVIQAGSDDGSGITDYLLALDGDGDPVGALRNISGTFSVVDLSDRKSKTNIRDTEVDALAIIEELRVVDYNRKTVPNGPILHGFIAQEAQEVFPEMVTQLDEDLLGISKDALIPIFAKAFQEQIRTNQELRRAMRQQQEEIARLQTWLTDAE